MKFTDGYWLTRDGYTVRRPALVYRAWAEGDRLRAVVPVAPAVRTRGDILNRPAATLTLWSPAPEVIGVRIDHHTGGVDRGPHFDLPGAGSPPVTVEVGDEASSLTSGRVTVTLYADPFRLELRLDGRLLTEAPPRSVGLVESPDGSSYVFQQLGLEVGERVFGLGERFGPVVKNGQTVDVTMADGGTSSEQAYKNVPFHWTTAGYGVLVNQPEEVSYEVGSESVSRTQFSVAGESLEYFLIAGPTPKEILGRYTALTGRAPRVPRWSFGKWLSTSFTTAYDEQTVTGFLDGMAERDLPLSVFHFDCYWMRGFRWCDFEWDPETFPEPEAMLARLKERGLRVCVWINPYIAQLSAMFDEGKERGFLVKRADGSVWQTDLWQAGMGLVDFTNPDATAWYVGRLEGLLDQGVDAFKTDFGERIPTDVVWHDGSDPARMHNAYTGLYNRAVHDLLRRRRGDGEAVLFARSATVGGQQFPVHWGGDCESTFVAMAETLRGGLSLSASGFAFWSHDIGGFEGTPDPTVFKRWLAFGLLSSHSRLHGSDSYRVPWAFDEEAVEVTRRFVRLKLSLMPYLLRMAEEASATGVPVLRPTVVEFPDDPATPYLDTQYLLGDSLLVAPVFRPDGVVRFYVPAGGWTSLLDGSVVEGPAWHEQTHALDSLPVLVRPGAVLPRGSREDSPEYEYADGVALHLYQPLALDRVEIVVPAGDPDGEATTFVVERSVEVLTARRTGGPAYPWSLVVHEDGNEEEVRAGDRAEVVFRLDR